MFQIDKREGRTARCTSSEAPSLRGGIIATVGRGSSFACAFFAGLLLLFAANTHASAEALVSADWLRRHLDDKDIVVLDVYSGDGKTAYSGGHIPGALFIDFASAPWREKSGAVHSLLPDPEETARYIGSLGIDNATHVVLAPGGRDGSDFNAVARIYWTFKVLGHDNLSILDGGDKAWFADASNPVATADAKAKPKTFAWKYRPEFRATRDDAKRAIKTNDAQLVDARPPAQYEGREKTSVVRIAGTLEGAVNLSFEEVETADGTRLADRAAIEKAIARAGVRTSGKQIVFCNTGHLSAGVWFVMHEIIGNTEAVLYEGSMADWTSDVTLPVVIRSAG